MIGDDEAELDRMRARVLKSQQDYAIVVREVGMEKMTQPGGVDVQISARMCGSIADYHVAPGGDGPLAAEWKDKPHRLLYDVLGEVQALTTEVARLHEERARQGKMIQDALDRGDQRERERDSARQQLAALTEERDRLAERVKFFEANITCESLLCPFEQRAKAAEADLAALRSGLQQIAQEMRDEYLADPRHGYSVLNWSKRLSALTTIPRTE